MEWCAGFREGRTMADTRLAGADFVRATACLMVVGHHICQRLSPGALPPWGTRTVTAVTMGAFGVGAFFVLSGYLLSRPFWSALDRGEAMPSLRTYAIRRAARIVPGFWLALTVSFMLSFTVLRFPFDGELLFRYVSGLALVAGFHWLTWFPVEFNGPLWSIGCEVASYAFLPCCLALLFLLPAGRARRWGGRLLWVAIVLAVVGLQALLVTHGQPDSQHRGWQYGLVGGAKAWWPQYSPIGFYAVFALGALAAGVQVRLAERRSALFDGLVALGLAVAIWSMRQHFPDAEGHGVAGIPYGFPLFPIGVALILVGAPSSVLVSRLTENAAIAFVARISFGIYVWHFLVMECIRMLYQPRYNFGSMYAWPQWAGISAAMLAVVVIIATLSYYLMEAPVIRWARRLEHRPMANAPTLSPAAG
jgi:peptidoglycan/LPS O-acetylase OafA/YrhL